MLTGYIHIYHLSKVVILWFETEANAESSWMIRVLQWKSRIVQSRQNLHNPTRGNSGETATR